MMNRNLKTIGRSPKIVKRKFPGPAGLLPEVRDLNVDTNVWEIGTSYDNQENMFCSQSPFGTFEDRAWTGMEEEFKNEKFLLEKYNISWILKSVESEPSTDDKVPFLAAKIKKMKNLNLILQDRTGEIEAVVSEELYERLSEFLSVNSVIVLKGFVVLSMSSTKKRYIVVTSNNLVKMYSSINNSKENNIGEDDLQIVTLQDFSAEELKVPNSYVGSKNVFDSPEFNLDDVELPPAKKPRTATMFNREEKGAGNGENAEPSITVLSQNDKDIEDVKSALDDIDSTSFFDDFCE